ncbi:MAG: hypothetical protein Kow0013_28890 [Pararhodobacter sp.]
MLVAALQLSFKGHVVHLARLPDAQKDRKRLASAASGFEHQTQNRAGFEAVGVQRQVERNPARSATDAGGGTKQTAEFRAERQRDIPLVGVPAESGFVGQPKVRRGKPRGLVMAQGLSESGGGRFYRMCHTKPVSKSPQHAAP